MSERDREKLGQRYACYECGTKFYDLKRPEPICPECFADQRQNEKGLATEERTSEFEVEQSEEVSVSEGQQEGDVKDAETAKVAEVAEVADS